MNTRVALLTTLSLLLAACGQPSSPVTQLPPTTPPDTTAPGTTPPVTPPATGRSGALYEVTFQGANSADVTASARAIGGATTLGLSTAPDTLKFERLSSETFITDSDHRRHVRATFKVTNTGSAAIDGLTLVPVDTDDADTDPSNNTAQPTVGTTPFNKVAYFDGSDASATAPSLAPAVGQRFNASSGAAETDPDASLFLTGQDVSGLSATPPAGLTIAGIKDYGWKVSDQLAAGASANVTFAVDLPANPDPKKDPFQFTLVFTNATSGPVAIHDIQGRTGGGEAPSPLNGRAVVTTGVVTADYQGSTQLKGFFMQAPDAAADSDPSTSEGIFVLCDVTCQDVKVGDTVRVAGTVTEFNTVTEIATVTGVTVTSSNTPLPAAQTVTLPVASLNDWERYEGMRVRVQGVVTENYKLGRGGVVKVADDRIPSYTQVNTPSVSGYAAYVAAIQRRTLSVDDGSTAQNPASVYGRGNQPLSAANTLRTGDAADVTGVLHYGFDYTGTPDTWRIESTPEGATFTGPARPAAPTVTGNVTVASANVLNFFTTLVTSNADSDNGGAPCTPDGVDSTNSRGANDCFEYKRQLAKVVSNLSGLNADVIGLMEVQNNTTIGKTGDTLGTLVTALNTALGGDVYAAVSHPSPGSDFIRVAMIYKKANVTPVGLPLTDTDPVNNRFPLAQVFQAAGGGQFAVVVNHLKSKGSGAGPDADQLDGQGGSANRRELQVARLLDLIQNQIVVGRGVQDVIAVGDFNAYAMEPSLMTLQKGLDGVAGTADDLSPVFDKSTYSYQFDAQFGSLDHAFVTRHLQSEGVNGEKWHDNSDEPTVLDYNKEFKTSAQVGTTAAPGSFFDPSAYRSSDHDPLKVGFTLAAATELGVTANGDATAYTGQPYTLSTPTTGTPDSLDIDWGDSTIETALPGSTTSRAHTYTTTGPVTITVTAHRGAATASATQTLTVAAPTITVGVSNASRDVYVGGASLGNTVTVTRTGYAGSVALSTAVSGTGTVPVVTVTGQPGTGTAGTLSIDGSAATPGIYTVTVTATGSGVTDATTTFTVNVKASATPGHLVISQVYGGGGNSGSVYTNDFIEVFNPTGAPISLNGYSLQYAAKAGAFTTTNTFVFPSGTTVAPGRYVLAQQAKGNGGTTPLPTPDFTGTLALSGTDGKVALVNGTAAISGLADPTVADFVGYGGANEAETSPTPVLSSVNSAQRASGGCTDTNNNLADFVITASAPRNSSAAANVCTP